jgi:hypothetical protein
MAEATSVKKPAATTRKRAPAKPKGSNVKELKIPEPVEKGRGRTAHRFSYTGKSAMETKPQTPQFVAMINGMQDIEDPSFDRSNFDLYTLVDFCVKEGHLDMPHTKNPDKQKRRIVACYKARLASEGYVVRA